ncbi:MAG: hypothetical protein DWQ10_10595, partial [Calditrichaeota bacterium]
MSERASLKFGPGIISIATDHPAQIQNEITNSIFNLHVSGLQNRQSDAFIKKITNLTVKLCDENKIVTAVQLIPRDDDNGCQFLDNLLKATYKGQRFTILSEQNIRSLFQFLVLPYTCDYPALFTSFVECFVAIELTASKSFAVLKNRVVLEEEARSLLVNGVEMATSEFNQKRQDFQKQTKIRDQYSALVEEQVYVKAEISQLQKKMRDCKANLNSIKNQEKQITNLIPTQDTVALLEEKKAFWEAQEKLFEEDKALREKISYYKNELYCDDQIIRRLQKEIRGLGNLEQMELDIHDSQNELNAFFDSTEEWIARAAEKLERTKNKGNQIKRKIEKLKTTSKQAETDRKIPELERTLNEMRRDFKEQKETYDRTLAALQKFRE